jgi:integrase
MRIGRTQSQRLDYLSEEEAEALLKRAWYKHPHMVGFCLCGLYSGGRPGEILALTRDDVRLGGHPSITYSHRKGKDGLVRTRTIDMHPKVVNWIIMHTPGLGHLIRDEKGRPYDWGAVGQRFYKAFLPLVSDAGLRHISPYVLRHTFATRLRWNGTELDEVRELLGHASIDESMI